MLNTLAREFPSSKTLIPGIHQHEGARSDYAKDLVGKLLPEVKISLRLAKTRSVFEQPSPFDKHTMRWRVIFRIIRICKNDGMAVITDRL